MGITRKLLWVTLLAGMIVLITAPFIPIIIDIIKITDIIKEFK